VTSPAAGDVLVKREGDGGDYFILEATTGDLLAGPFARIEYALGIAHSFAWKRPGSRIWGQNGDRPITLLCSAPHTIVDVFPEISHDANP
jgi:hypothetical protein